MGKLIMNSVATNPSGLTPAEQKSRYGNAIISANVNGEVYVKDCIFAKPGYNCFEIGLDTKVEPPSKITFENCEFYNELTNNAILVFATKDNATITLKNCKFESVSNALRVSNRTNAKNVTVNIIDCSVDKWESIPKYAGFLILEDYTSKNMAEFEEANRFGPDKLTINISNLVHNGKPVRPGGVEQVVNCNNANQVIYLYRDNLPADYRYPEYDPDIFPVINIK
jgi:hypothetical protein